MQRSMAKSEMCSERDSPLKRLYRRTHAKLTRLAGSGQLVWAAGCELSLALVHARWPAWPGETSETILRVASPRKTRPLDHTQVNWPVDASASGSAQVGATDEPREFRLARSRQDKRLERAIPLTTHLWLNARLQYLHWRYCSLALSPRDETHSNMCLHSIPRITLWYSAIPLQSSFSKILTINTPQLTPGTPFTNMD